MNSRFLPLAFLLLLFAPSVQATHLMGGEITWDCLGSGEVRFTMKLYQDCRGNDLLNNNETMDVHNHPSINGINMTLQSRIDISPVCAGGGGPDCNSNDPGSVEEFTYVSGDINLGNFVPPAAGWVFTYDGCCRNNTITNISNPNSTGMTVRSKMYAYNGQTGFPCTDSSPRFAQKPTAVTCLGYPQTYNHNGSDPELDSLSFKWAAALDDFNGAYVEGSNPVTATMISPYTISNPLPNTAGIDDASGEICYDPSTVQGEFVTVVSVESWRDNQLIAEVFRELQVIILPCGGQAPPTVVLPISGTQTGCSNSFLDTVVAGSLVQFNFTGYSAGSGVSIEASSTQFSSNYANPNFCDNPPCALMAPPPVTGFFQPDSAIAYFVWQTDCDNLNDGTLYQDQATFIFVVTHQDDVCPVAGRTVSTIAITVIAKDPAPAPEVHCTAVNPITGDVTITWDPIQDTGSVFDEYRIYRSDTQNGTYVQVGSVGNINTSVFTDVSANADNQRHYYYVSTKSTCTADDALPLDTVSTIDVAAAAVGSEVTVSWNPVTDPLRSSSDSLYYVFREFPIGTWALFDSTTSTSIVDTTFTTCSDSVNYLVQIGDSLGCTSFSNYGGTSFANASPVAAFTNSTPCAGAFIDFTDGSTISAGTIIGWDWDFGDSNTSTQQDPSHLYGAVGTYTVKLVVTSDLGCQDSVSVMITTQAGANANAGTDTQICPGDSVQLTATGGTTGYTWTPAAGLSSTTIANPMASPAATTDYIVEADDGSGCNDFDTVRVVVLALPAADAGLDTAICIGGTASLSASGGTGYVWSTAEVTQAISVTPVVQTKYYVTVTDANTCTNTDSVTVDINALPTADAGNDTTICIGDDVQIGGSPTSPTGTGYTWSNSGTLNNNSLANPTATPLVPTTYTVTVVDANGCTATNDIAVSLDALPTITTSNDTSICTDGAAQLSASGGVAYLWSPASTLDNVTSTTPIATPDNTVTYTVRVTDANTCQNTATITVTVFPQTVVTISNDTNICLNSTVSVDASGGVSYAWDTGANTPSISVTPLVTTIYTVTVTDGNGCTSSDDSEVRVFGLPTVDAGSDTTVCIGDSARLGGSPTGTGTTFLWSPAATIGDATIGNPMAAPAVATKYYVTITDTRTCQSVDSMTVSLFSLPTADAGVPDTICLNDSTQLLATGGTSYNWFPTISLDNSTAANPIAFPNSTRTYLVTVTDGNMCSSIDSVEIVVNNLPAANAGNDIDICIGGSANLLATGGTGYVWSNGAATAATTVSPAVTSTYTVSVTDANACVNEDSVLVTVNSLPVVDAGNDASICLNQSTVIGGSPTGPGGSSYVWSGAATLNDNTSANPTATPIVTTKYYVTVTDGNTCVNIDSVTITVDSLPVPVVSNDTSICFNDTAFLSAAGGTSYQWSPVSTLDNATSATPNATPDNTVTYIVTVTDGNTCTGVDSVAVTVFDLPLADAGTDTTICVGDPVTRTATGGTGYVWSTGANIAPITVSPLATTTYTVTVTDANTCSQTDTVVVTVNDLPVIDAGLDQTICVEDSVQIGGSPTGPVGSGYVWSSAATLGNNTDANPMAGPATTTKYYVTVTDVNLCVNLDSVIVNVDSLPIPVVSNDTAICLNDNALLSAAGGTAYVWSPAGTLNNPTSATPIASPTTSTTYLVTVTDGNTCSDTASVFVEVYSLPPANAGLDTTICINDSAALSATGGTGYIWSTGATTADITVGPIATTTYTVTVTDANTCAAVDSVVVNVNLLPVVDAGNDQTICFLDSVQIGGAPTGPVGSVYVWSSAATLSDNTDANPMASPAITTEYFVTVTDLNTCVNLDSMTVNVDSLPVPVVSNDTAICLNDNALLSAAGGTSYVWSPAGTLNNPTSATPVASPTTSTTYSVTVTDGNTCSDTASVFVEVYSLPPANAGLDTTICINDSAALSATGGTGYVWSTGATTADINVGPIATTTYTVTVTDANTCAAVDSVVVNVNLLPVVDAGNDQTICFLDSVQIGGAPTGPVGSVYVWSSAATLSDNNNANPMASPAITTEYFVTVTDLNTCVNLDSMTVNVDTLPIPVVSNDTAICLNDNALLSAAGGTSYVWSPAGTLNNPTSATPIASPTTSTTYLVTVTDGNTCSDTASVFVEVYSLPPANAGLDTAICINDSAALSATGGTGYVWSTGATTADINVGPMATTTYTVTVTDANTCAEVDSVVVNVNLLPVVDAGNDQTICFVDSVQIGGAPTGPAGSAYVWSSAATLSNNTDANPMASPAITTEYFVTVTDLNTCVNLDSMTVNVDTLPIPVVSNDTAICLNDNAFLSAAGGTAYVWSPAGTLNNPTSATPIASPTTSTTYLVTVTDGNTCSDTASVFVEVYSLPPANAGLDTAICINDSAALSATGGTGYVWSTGATTANINVGPIATTTYTVTVTDANTCAEVDSVVVNVNLLPVVDAGNDQTICFVDSVQIGGAPTGPAGSAYVWSSAATLSDNTDANPMASPAITTEYFVTVTDLNTCVNLDSMTVNVDTLPIPVLSSDTAICLNDSALLSAAGGTTYLWSPAGSLDNATSATPVATPINSTTYQVTVTDGNTCSDTASVFVQIFQLPPAEAGTNVEICIGDSTTLTATGGTGYQWSTGAGTAVITVGPTDTTTYWVTVTDGNTCAAADSVIVTVNPLPIVDAGTHLTICNEDTIAIGGAPTGPALATYVWSPAATLDNATAANPNAFPSDTTWYTVIVTDSNTCVQTDSMRLNVNQLPTASAGNDLEICITDSIQLTATGGVGYLWSPATGLSDPTSATPMASPADTTDYMVLVTDVNGCQDTDTMTLTVNPLPNAEAGPSVQICINDSTQLQASGGDTYVWSPATGLSATNIGNPMAGPTDTTTYVVLVTDSNSCQLTDSMTVTVNPLPIVDPGTELTICNEDTIAIGGAPTGPAQATYVWSPAATLNNATAANPNAFPSDTTWYTVVVTDSNTCVQTDSMRLNVNQLPTASAGNDLEICITDSIQLTATGGVGYLWSPATGLSDPTSATPMASPADTTDYMVLVTDVNGCQDTDTMTLTVNPLPNAEAGPSVQICINDSTQLQASGGDTYVWSPATGLSATNIGNPMAGPTDTTTYVVLVTDSNSCQLTDSMTVTVNPLPIVDAGPDIQICIGGGTVIGGAPTGPALSTYLWSPNDSLDDNTLALPFANPTDTTTYTVMVTDSNTCVDYDSMIVVVNPLPNVDAGTDTAICVFDTLQLTATGAATYVWLPAGSLSDDSIANPLAFPLDTTTYYVTAIDSNTCINIDSITIWVDTLPIVDAGADLWLCPGDSIQLGASGALSYLWTPGAALSDSTIANPTTILADTNQFVVFGTNIKGCVNTDTMQVIVNGVVPTDAGPDQGICIFDSVQIGGIVTAPPQTVYTWNTSATLSDSTISNPVAGPIDTTIYVINTLNDTCKGTDTVLVIVNPLPAAYAGLDVEICVFDSTQLQATGGADYVWTPGGALNNDSIANPMAAPDTTTQYTVMVTDSNTCVNFDSMIVTVHPLPTPFAGLDTAICVGDTMQLNATGGANYVWTPALGLSNDSIGNPLANPLSTTNYVVQVTDSNTCVNFDSVLVTVNQLPPASAGPDLAICIGDSIQLDGSGGILYGWTPNIAMNDTSLEDPTVWPTDTIQYHVLVTDTNGCFNNDSMVVTVNPLPNADAGVNTEICIGESTQLQASGGVSYVWENDPALDNLTVADPTATPTDTTWFVVAVTDSNTCVNTDSVRIDVNQLPAADAGADIALCYGDTAMLLATGGEDYLWSPNTNLSNTNIDNPMAWPEMPITYTVEVTDSNNCTNFDSVYVHVFRVTAEGDVTVCEKDSAILNVTTNGVPASYQWTPTDGMFDANIQSPTVGLDDAGSFTYEVLVTDANGCTDVDDVQIEVLIDPTANFEVTYAPTCAGVEVTFENNTDDANGYSWDFGNGSTSTDAEPVQLFQFTEVNTVTLVASNQQLCVDSTSFQVSAFSFDQYLDLGIPNVFSPNNDGMNDNFTVPVPPGMMDCATLDVWNRWGTHVFSTSNGVPVWDGNNSFSGGLVAPGPYFYTFTIGTFVVNGSVTVLYGN